MLDYLSKDWLILQGLYLCGAFENLKERDLPYNLKKTPSANQEVHFSQLFQTED